MAISTGFDAEKRRADLLACNRRAKFPVVFDAHALSHRIAEETSVYQNHTKYQIFGFYALDTFVKNTDYASAPLTNNIESTAGSGFDDLARMLSFAPITYAAYCKRRDINPSLVELGDALQASSDTAAKFLTLPSATDARANAAFNLRNGRDRLRDTRFVFEETDDGPRYKPDPTIFATVTANLDNDYDISAPRHWQRCPARRLVTERIWPAMVQLAIDTPELFPHDLAAATIDG